MAKATKEKTRSNELKKIAKTEYEFIKCISLENNKAIKLNIDIALTSKRLQKCSNNALFHICSISLNDSFDTNKYLRNKDTYLLEFFNTNTKNKYKNIKDFIVKYVFDNKLKKYKWKDFSEYIEKRIYPYFYAVNSMEKINHRKVDYICLIVEKLKDLEAKIHQMKEDRLEDKNKIKELKERGYIDFTYNSNFICELSTTEENALIRIFRQLSKGNKKFWTQLIKQWNKSYTPISKEMLIYYMAYPTNKRMGIRIRDFEKGYERPKVLKVNDILSCLKDNKVSVSRPQIINICNQMNIELDHTKGRPKKEKCK